MFEAHSLASLVPLLLAACAPAGPSGGGVPDTAPSDTMGEPPIAGIASGTTAISGVCAGTPQCTALEDTTRWTAPAGWVPSGLVLGDVTGDGYQDSGYHSPEGLRLVPGPLRESKDLSLDSFLLEGWGMAANPAGDVNQDGIDDLWVHACLPGDESPSCSKQTWVLVPGPVGPESLVATRAQGSHVSFGGTREEVFAGDVNGDGWVDLTTFQYGTDSDLVVYHGPFLDGSWTGEPAARFRSCDGEGDWLFAPYWSRPDVRHDATGDGVPDIIVPSTGADDCARSLVIDGSATGELTEDSPAVVYAGSSEFVVFVGDVTGDGISDFAGSFSGTYTLYAGPLALDGTVVTSAVLGTPAFGGFSVEADLTGDGLADGISIETDDFADDQVVEYHLHEGGPLGFVDRPSWIWRSATVADIVAAGTWRAVYTEDGVTGALGGIGSDTYLLERP